MKIVSVLDMDFTLGYCDDNHQFHVRPFAACFVRALAHAGLDIILWSSGTDDYVKTMVNCYLPFIRQHALYIFARTLCDQSEHQYGFQKYSTLIRNLYTYPIQLMGVDDNAHAVMDGGYDMRYHVTPYKTEKSDVELIKILDAIFIHLDTPGEAGGFIEPNHSHVGR